MNVKPIFSDDRGECLEHYGVKGMKWHQHIKSRLDEELRESGLDSNLRKSANDAKVVSNAKSYAQGLKRSLSPKYGRQFSVKAVTNIVSGSAREAKLSKVGSRKVRALLGRVSDKVYSAKRDAREQELKRSRVYY